jgi:hypothetical protein
MLSKTTIILTLAIAMSSASAASAAAHNGKDHRGAPAVERQVPASARAAHAEVKVRKPTSDFERIWFRQAEGPEWN